ncbi:MAG: DUF2330 domain-containing protein, partial [Candidatus Thermoplasmatota archaeon]
GASKMIWRNKLIRSLFACLVILFGSLEGTEVMADKCMVVVNPVYIPLYEPGQKAIICWNGTEELLTLATDVKAEEPTKALEILPLPSEPDIKISNVSVFEKLKKLVVRYAERKAAGEFGVAKTGVETPEVEIIFHEKLGVHNITVIKAYTKEGFAKWVNNFMESVGLTPMSFPKAENMASVYMERGINYFVLDLIELTTEVLSPEPLMYRFNSTSIYYPMEITSIIGGETHILLFILTPHKVIKPPYKKKEHLFFGVMETTWQDELYINVKTPDSPVNFRRITDIEISPHQLQREAKDEYIYDKENYSGIYELYDFFKKYDAIKVGVYEYKGSVEFKGDIAIKEYSTQTVKVDEKFELNTVNLLLAILIPPVVVTIILVAFILYMGRKYQKK